jgi:hypothetical protein
MFFYLSSFLVCPMIDDQQLCLSKALPPRSPKSLKGAAVVDSISMEVRAVSPQGEPLPLPWRVINFAVELSRALWL